MQKIVSLALLLSSLLIWPIVPVAFAQGNQDVTDFDTAMMDNINATIFNGAPAAELTTPRGIISRLLPYLFSFAGIILFVMLIWGGFEMLSGAANPKSQEAGKNRITSALIGFFILFASFWLGLIVQAVFGISIL